MRLPIALTALALLASQAPLVPQVHAQTTPAPATTDPAAPTTASPAPAATAPAHARKTMQDRFDQANTTHDGHLTLDQAKAGMPIVAKHFTAIDKDKKGYVTMDDIHAYSASRKAHNARHSNSAS